MPKCTAEYNHSMGGVGTLGYQISLYKTRIRGKKWWFPAFSQFLDVTVVYAWRLYQEASGDKKMTLLTASRKIEIGSYSELPLLRRRHTTGKIW